jgi:hypothetical protein
MTGYLAAASISPAENAQFGDSTTAGRATALMLCIRARLYRLRKNSCFVSGHDFSRAVEERDGEMRVVPIRSESPFARYRGIGNPQIGSGKKAILEWLRTQRGE